MLYCSKYVGAVRGPLCEGMFKNYIQKKLERLTAKYFAKHPDVKLIVVTGSVGKTSTKMAIATILSQQYRVRVEEGNHNTAMSAPLAMLGVPYPDDIRNPFAWRKVFKQMRQRIKQPADVDIVVQELGADHPGDIQAFSRYLHPHLCVVTAITPEHMEYFGTIEAVASEELSVVNFSQFAVVNGDDIEPRFLQSLPQDRYRTYGTAPQWQYAFASESVSIDEGYRGRVVLPGAVEPLAVSLKVVGEHNIRPVMAAIAVAAELGMSPAHIAQGANAVQPVAGRMNVLDGVKGSILLDDTYNSSPAAAAAALNTLSRIVAPQKIAILGDMNELGVSSPDEHAHIGRMCQPSKIDWVVTIGEQSARYLAPAAQANGCYVKSFPDAISAGSFVHSQLQTGAVVLAKGSQGGIFAEEAVKILLRSTADTKRLVRQSPAWLEAKTKHFSKF